MVVQVRGVRIERLAGYPVHGWAFSGADNTDSLASLVGHVCMQLQAANVPHNLLICDAGSRVLLWPQQFAARQARGEVPEDVLETGVNPAAFEIAGHMVLKRREDYDALTEARAWELLQHVGLSNDDMAVLEERVFATYMTPAAPAAPANVAAPPAATAAADASVLAPMTPPQHDSGDVTVVPEGAPSDAQAAEAAALAACELIAGKVTG